MKKIRSFDDFFERAYRKIYKAIAKIRYNKYMSDRVSSASDNSLYPAFCKLASENASVFKNFRRSPIYNDILENLTEYQGVECLWYIYKNNKIKFTPNEWCEFQKNDLYGHPRKFNYDVNFSGYLTPGWNVGDISPTTVRYVKILQDLTTLFDFTKINDIHECGVGYGGQCRVILSYIKTISNYFLYDLPEVLCLTQKYLENYTVTSKVTLIDSTVEFPSANMGGFFISCCAFSELSRSVQEIYIEKVVKYCSGGYITWNELSYVNTNGYSVDELLGIIPNSKVIEELPLTHPTNKIIVWGTKSIS